VLARKPLIGTVAQNVQAHGTGALNIDGSRIPITEADRASWERLEGFNKTPRTSGRTYANGKVGEADDRSGFESKGRWPANVIHDGSDEVLEAFAKYGEKTSGTFTDRKTAGIWSSDETDQKINGCVGGDTGTAARFFYSSKADASDRLGSKHATVKPVDLMAYLICLITPPKGTVLDPFAGSGTTGMAALREGFECILIEKEAEHVEDCRRRLAHVRGEDTPLFAGEGS
jgi:site-specific DNA-methyltransferase (adenine-specific)